MKLYDFGLFLFIGLVMITYASVIIADNLLEEKMMKKMRLLDIENLADEIKSSSSV